MRTTLHDLKTELLQHYGCHHTPWRLESYPQATLVAQWLQSLIPSELLRVQSASKRVTVTPEVLAEFRHRLGPPPSASARS